MTKEKTTEINLLLDIERKEKEALKKKLEMLELEMREMSDTTNNLVAATWRERKKLEETIKELQTTVSALDTTKTIIENQSRKISESISYAQKIQVAMNPTEKEILEVLPNSFAFYKPKDIVSGDFPYFLKIGDFIFVGAIDCTGHGVPGAMLAMIGKLLLNDILNKGKVQSPAEVLDQLHQLVIHNLKQEDVALNFNCGMDVALFCVNKRTNELMYAGAHRPFWYIRNGEMQEFKGDIYPIGGIQYKNRITYTNYSLQLEHGDRFFIFSDGFPDQTGEENKKRYTTQKLKNFLINLKTSSIQNIGNLIADEFENWRGNQAQIDDVLILGFEW